MTEPYHITLARPADLHLLPAIELAAARQLDGYAPASVLAEVTSEADLYEAQRGGLLWVALREDMPVGFAHLRLIEPNAVHLQELDVHPDHGRRGVGRRLVGGVCVWAAECGFESVTLTTFRDVPWNMPFYARLGFVEIPADDVSAPLQGILDLEVRSGLDPARRVAMRWRARA